MYRLRFTDPVADPAFPQLFQLFSSHMSKCIKHEHLGFVQQFDSSVRAFSDGEDTIIAIVHFWEIQWHLTCCPTCNASGGDCNMHRQTVERVGCFALWFACKGSPVELLSAQALNEFTRFAKIVFEQIDERFYFSQHG